MLLIRDYSNKIDQLWIVWYNTLLILTKEFSLIKSEKLTLKPKALYWPENVAMN